MSSEKNNDLMLLYRRFSSDECIKTEELRKVLKIISGSDSVPKLADSKLLDVLLCESAFTEIEKLLKAQFYRHRRCIQRLERMSMEMGLLECQYKRHVLEKSMQNSREHLLKDVNMIQNWIKESLQLSETVDDFRRIFLLHISGDISRYAYECTLQSAFKEKSLETYNQALLLSAARCIPSDEVHISLCISYSCMFLLCGDEEIRAKCEDLLDEMIVYTDVFHDEKYASVSAKLQLIQSNITRPA